MNKKPTTSNIIQRLFFIGMKFRTWFILALIISIILAIVSVYRPILTQQIVDIDILKQSLNDLIYPKFNGEHTITSPIWNNSDIRVWQFQLNQIATGVVMQTNYNDAELNLDQVLSSIRIWRKSLEIGSENPDVIYKQNDLIYKLMDLEQKLDLVQEYLEH